MTFFNKKTEVMQIEMTPYGRYLYSIGKFKPHSYEFVDDDILYKSGSSEDQESIHNRIINETPKLKINRAFQDEAPQLQAPSRISDMRVMQKRMTQRQNGIQALGRSSYSSDNMPSFQVTMLRGHISGSSNTFETNQVYNQFSDDTSGSIHIPQIHIDSTIDASLRNVLQFPNENVAIGGALTSQTFDDGNYVSIFYQTPIIHLKEFNSFYEKENFEIEVFLSGSNGSLTPLKNETEESLIVNDILMEPKEPVYSLEGRTSDFVQYFFDIEVDNEIDPTDLCKAVDNLEINNQFLDEELICPDARTERFDIYDTRVGPEDLEDCDD